jgi:hypothetical protein
MNCVAARWGQATPGQDGDEMARHHLPGQDACQQLLEGEHHIHEVSPLLHVHDGLLHHHFWDSAKLNLKLPLQSSHVYRERLLHFLLHAPPKKEIKCVPLRRVGGQNVPPKPPLDGIHTVLVSSLSITILPGLVLHQLVATKSFFTWLFSGSASWQGRHWPPTAACS